MRLRVYLDSCDVLEWLRTRGYSLDDVMLECAGKGLVPGAPPGRRDCSVYRTIGEDGLVSAACLLVLYPHLLEVSRVVRGCIHAVYCLETGRCEARRMPLEHRLFLDACILARLRLVPG